MAAAAGPDQKDPKPKKEITPEQRKLYTQLGFIGFLSLVVAIMYLPGMLSGGGSSTPLPTAPTTDAAPAPPGPPGPPGAPGATPPAGAGGPDLAADGGAGATAAAPPATGVGAPTISLPLRRNRPDPFVKLYLIPTPAPPIPPPVSVPLPSDQQLISLPGFRGNTAALTQPLVLPPVRITRLDEAARIPADAFPPRRTVGTAAGGGTINPSYDKRLSGVVIGDGVRAILEIRTGTANAADGSTGVVTHVVQPGDEVDGITVLSIQRINDGTKTVTQMIIRENGEERSVDLRASPQAATAAAGGLGGPGAPGGGA